MVGISLVPEASQSVAPTRKRHAAGAAAAGSLTGRAEPRAPDHRVRVGAQRREKTRLRLLETALTVFNEKGPDAAVIDDFVAAAGVSRGTFYNHFKTTQELLLALATAMSDEVLRVIDPLVLQFTDPVQRFSTGTRLYMAAALRYPLWGSFLTRVGTRIAARGQLIDRYLTRDIGLALKSKRIKADSVPVARDIVLGSIFYGIETMLTEPTRDGHPEHIMHCVLVGLGLDVKDAEAIAHMPLPPPGAVDAPIFSTLEAARSALDASSKAKTRASQR